MLWFALPKPPDLRGPLNTWINIQGSQHLYIHAHIKRVREAAAREFVLFFNLLLVLLLLLILRACFFHLLMTAGLCPSESSSSQASSPTSSDFFSTAATANASAHSATNHHLPISTDSCSCYTFTSVVCDRHTPHQRHQIVVHIGVGIIRIGGYFDGYIRQFRARSSCQRIISQSPSWEWLVFPELSIRLLLKSTQIVSPGFATGAGTGAGAGSGAGAGGAT